MAMLSHMISSPKATIKEVLQPSHHRTFSLEADEIHDMHFNEPEEPSKMHMEYPEDFQLQHELPEEKARSNDHMELIDAVITTRFDP